MIERGDKVKMTDGAKSAMYQKFHSKKAMMIVPIKTKQAMIMTKV